MGHAGVLHDRGHVGKVQVNKSGVFNQVRDGLHRLAQHVVGHLKGIGQGDLLLGDKLQPVIGDDHQGIHLGPQVLNAQLRLLHPAAAFKGEGLGHHTHRQDVHFLGQVGQDGGRPRPGAAAHAGGDKHHVGPLQGLGNLGAALLRGLAAHLGVGAGALALGQLFPDLNFMVCAGDSQCLFIGVHGNELNALHTRFHHAVDHVAAAAAYADHLNIYNGLCSGIQSKRHDRSS